MKGLHKMNIKKPGIIRYLAYILHMIKEITSASEKSPVGKQQPGAHHEQEERPAQ